MPYKDPEQRREYHRQKAAEHASKKAAQIKERKAAWFQAKKATLRVQARLKYRLAKGVPTPGWEVVDGRVVVEAAKAKAGLTRAELMDMLVALEQPPAPAPVPSAGKPPAGSGRTARDPGTARAGAPAHPD